MTTNPDDEDRSASPKTVVVLGAGFSLAAFSSFLRTDELGEAVRERLSPADAAKLPTGEFTDGRFEEWLSYVSEPQPHLDPADVIEASALALRVTQEMCAALSERQAEALGHEPPDWFFQFLSVLHVLRAQVITLNYDNLVECGLHSLGIKGEGWFGPYDVCEDDILAGLPPCADFPGIEMQSPVMRSDLVVPINLEERRSNTFKLLKLHGSLSWWWWPEGSGSSTIHRWRLPGKFGEPWDPAVERRRQELPRHEVFVVPPATLKGQRLREPVARELWHRAAEALREADRVVLIGYSIPTADHSMMGMLAEGLEGRRVQIEVVNTQASDVEDRLIRLGIARESISKIAGDDCVAEWTAKEVSRLTYMATDSMRTSADLTEEDLIFLDDPRQERMVRVDGPDASHDSVVLYLNPQGQQLTRPMQVKDLREAFGAAKSCTVECDGRMLPVIDYWTISQESGVLMSQLHVVVAGR
ncbi:MAG: hypothetical protein ACRDZR_00010 [Acidimicrobiales bacterium]